MNADVNARRPRKERVENAARRRRQLIEATIDAIAQHGLSGATLATVAERAGLSQGSAVFYFQTKEQLFLETLRAHYEDYRAAWSAAYEAPHDGAVEKLTAVIAVDLSDQIFTPRNLTLWHSCWGEVKARPMFAELSQHYDNERLALLLELARAAADRMSAHWSPESFANAVDALTDGFWIGTHIGTTMPVDGLRELLARFLSSIFEDDQAMIYAALTESSQSGRRKRKKGTGDGGR